MSIKVELLPNFFSDKSGLVFDQSKNEFLCDSDQKTGPMHSLFTKSTLQQEPSKALLFFKEIETAFENPRNEKWLRASSFIIDQLQLIQNENVLKTINKIKQAQTFYKETHDYLKKDSPGFVFEDLDYLKKVLIRSPRCLYLIPKEAQSALAFELLELITHAPYLIEDVHPEVQFAHLELPKTAIDKQKTLKGIASEVISKLDRKYLMELMEVSPSSLSCIPEEVLLKYPEIALKAFGQYRSNLIHLPKDLIMTLPLPELIEAVRAHPFVIRVIPHELMESCPEIAIISVQKDYFNLAHIPTSIIKDIPLDILTEVLEKGPDYIKHIPEELQLKYPDLPRIAVSRRTLSLEFVPTRVQLAYKDIPLEAIRKQPKCLSYTGKLGEIPSFAKDAIRQNFRAFNFLSDALIRDHDFLKDLIDPMAEILTSSKRDKELFKEEVTSYSHLETKLFIIRKLLFSFSTLPSVIHPQLLIEKMPKWEAHHSTAPLFALCAFHSWNPEPEALYAFKTFVLNFEDELVDRQLCQQLLNFLNKIDETKQIPEKHKVVFTLKCFDASRQMGEINLTKRKVLLERLERASCFLKLMQILTLEALLALDGFTAELLNEQLKIDQAYDESF